MMNSMEMYIIILLKGSLSWGTVEIKCFSAIYKFFGLQVHRFSQRPLYGHLLIVLLPISPIYEAFRDLDCFHRIRGFGHPTAECLEVFRSTRMIKRNFLSMVIDGLQHFRVFNEAYFKEPHPQTVLSACMISMLVESKYMQILKDCSMPPTIFHLWIKQFPMDKQH